MSPHQRPGIIAHKGFAMSWPENTLTAIRGALGLGSPEMAGIEIDIQLTGDGRIVMWHDADLKQIVGQDIVIRNTAYAAIAQITRAHPHFAGEPMALLEDVLAATDHKTALYIEIKAYPYAYDTLIEALRKLLTSYAPRRDIILHSFSPDMLRRTRAAMSELGIRFGFLFGAIAELQHAPSDVIASMDYLHPHFNILTSHGKELADQNKPLNIWTVNGAADVRNLAESSAWPLVESIITDNNHLYENH
ncbi:MAG: glycerophosphodiester phosphodiesterase family protein [Spirochaetota bacterium]